MLFLVITNIHVVHRCSSCCFPLATSTHYSPQPRNIELAFRGISAYFRDILACFRGISECFCGISACFRGISACFRGILAGFPEGGRHKRDYQHFLLPKFGHRFGGSCAKSLTIITCHYWRGTS